MELEENKRIMIDALKKVYKDQYDTIQPIPYVKDKLYCVDKVFKGNPPTDFKKLNRRKLNSYEEIFTEDNIQSHRCIIDGEPGYGKSTLTLQLAYDWSNGISDSPLCDVKIFIFLRLRQLKNLGSIYKAIKHILLSTEPRLKVKDIQQILETCSSVVYALDGYDEFPHQNEEQNDINKILTSDLLQNIDVTLTTRVLPTQLTRVNDSHSSDGLTTKLVKLRGFDEAAREQYIRKAVTGDDDTAVERIKEQLRENHAINALCQVPLLFVIFAHMCLDDHVIPTISTVTGAVRHMISCFHKHMREKMKDYNVKTLPDFENEHSELDKIAFDGLQNQHLIWKREELRQQLGAAFYDMYVRIGILEEEKFPIESLSVSLGSYHVDSEGILFPFGLRIPFFNTLKQLGVEFGERKEIREEEVVAALQTAMNFERLNEIRFDYCTLPQQMPTVASVIDTRDISSMMGFLCPKKTRHSFSPPSVRTM